MIFLVSRGRNKRGYKINDFSVWLFLWGSHFSRVFKNKDAGTTGALPRHFRGSASEAPGASEALPRKCLGSEALPTRVLRASEALPRHFRGSASEARKKRIRSASEQRRKSAKSASEARRKRAQSASAARWKRVGSASEERKKRVGSASIYHDCIQCILGCLGRDSIGNGLSASMPKKHVFQNLEPNSGTRSQIWRPNVGTPIGNTENGTNGTISESPHLDVGVPCAVH